MAQKEQKMAAKSKRAKDGCDAWKDDITLELGLLESCRIALQASMVQNVWCASNYTWTWSPHQKSLMLRTNLRRKSLAEFHETQKNRQASDAPPWYSKDAER